MEETREEQWLKLVITSNPVLVDSITDYLIGVVGAGVEAAAEDNPNHGVVTAYRERANITSSEFAQMIGELTKYLENLATVFSCSVPQVESSFIVNEDWSSSWKAHFVPYSIVDGLVIKPTWADYIQQDSELIITMDPGMAFGTGHHATTTLCLEYIKEFVDDSNSLQVLDVGTGTAILAMAASLFGADRILAIDTDPEAIRVARENVDLNGLQKTIEVSGNDLSTITGQYQIVVANIVHDILMALASDLAKVTARGGVLIVSGILHGNQSESIQTEMESHGFVVHSEKEKGEWVALSFKKS